MPLPKSWKLVQIPQQPLNIRPIHAPSAMRESSPISGFSTFTSCSSDDCDPIIPQKRRRPNDVEESRKKVKWKHSHFMDPETLVTFVVGSKEKTKEFLIHEEAVYKHSSVLKAAFESKFAEGQTRIYKLEDVNPAAFRFFVQWAYSGELRLHDLNQDYCEFCAENWPKEKAGKDKKDKNEDSDYYCGLVADGSMHEDNALVEAWALADKFAVPDLQNYIIEVIFQRSVHSRSLKPDTLHYIYENTSRDSQLRKMTAYLGALFIKADVLDEQKDNFPHAFLIELAQGLLRKSSNHSSTRKLDKKVDYFFVPTVE